MWKGDVQRPPICPFPLLGLVAEALPLTSHLMTSGCPGSSVGFHRKHFKLCAWAVVERWEEIQIRSCARK